MSDDFAALKARIDLTDYITQRTSKTVKNIGSDTLDLSECPFCGGHDCFRIYPQERRFHCFQCTSEPKGGDVFDFVQRHENCDKKEALRILAKDQGCELTSQQPDTVSRSPEEEKALQNRSAIFEEAAGYYHKAVYEKSQAIGYQRKVRRHSDETLKAFRVGCSDGRLYEHLKSKKYADEQLIESGLVKLREGRLYDFFSAGLYIYPHSDRDGRVIGFTQKDPDKKLKYRLAGEYWGPGGFFYNMQAFGGDKLFLVEGENDLLTVYGRGGFQRVAAINGQISNDQLDYLARWAPGKTVYLCFDNDKAGQGYIEKVCKALAEHCLPATLVRLLKARATTVRIIRFDTEIKDIDDYLKNQTDPKAALKALMDGAELYLPPLKTLKFRYERWLDGDAKSNGKEKDEGKDKNEDKVDDNTARENDRPYRKFDFNTYGQICFEWFQAQGKFFIDGETCHLYFHNRIYQIGSNTPFEALLDDMADINAAANGARLVFQRIKNHAYLKGDHTSVPGWIFTNFKESTIYFNLCGERNNLLKISPGKIETVPNGTNAERVLLRNSPKMLPLKFIQDADIAKGMAALKTHIFDNLACEIADRYFIVCLLFNVVLLQYVKARGITKFSGTKGSGKTAAASMLSAIIYGEDCVTTGSAASDFSEAAVSPLTISDNLESDAVRGGKRDFLLTVATGITRQKRKSGSDSGNVYERSCTQLLVTSIEPFTEPELIERTNEIIFDKCFHNPAFKEAVAVETDLREARDLIWSTIFKIISQNILPDIEQRKAEALKSIRKDYPNHSKARLNELYAMLFLILGEVVKFISQPGHDNDPSQTRFILHEWIQAQNKRAFATEADTNKILYGLEALAKEYSHRSEGFEKQYGIKIQASRDIDGELLDIAITASTRELFMAFGWLAKDRGIANPAFPPEEARCLAERLEIHHTPKHGSWLNIAEIELSVLKRQCLAGRIDCIEKMRADVTAWNTDRTKVDWQFRTKDARIKLKRLYPKF